MISWCNYIAPYIGTGGKGTAAGKFVALENAGVTITCSPADIGKKFLEIIASSRSSVGTIFSQ
jgi:succinyl-CoA synthetase alpha subunit